MTDDEFQAVVNKIALDIAVIEENMQSGFLEMKEIVSRALTAIGYREMTAELDRLRAQLGAKAEYAVDVSINENVSHWVISGKNYLRDNVTGEFRPVVKPQSEGQS